MQSPKKKHQRRESKGARSSMFFLQLVQVSVLLHGPICLKVSHDCDCAFPEPRLRSLIKPPLFLPGVHCSLTLLPNGWPQKL